MNKGINTINAFRLYIFIRGGGGGVRYHYSMCIQLYIVLLCKAFNYTLEAKYDPIISGASMAIFSDPFVSAELQIMKS